MPCAGYSGGPLASGLDSRSGARMILNPWKRSDGTGGTILKIAIKENGMGDKSGTRKMLPIYRLDLALRAYAYYGLKLESEDTYGDHTDAFLEEWESDNSRFPLSWCREEEKEIITAALARSKLDHPDDPGRDTMTPDELAALARVSRKSIMNLLAPSNRSLLSVDQRGQTAIGIESARRWLSDRPDFRPSVWQYQEDMVGQTPHSILVSISACDHPVRPARFSASCRKRAGREARYLSPATHLGSSGQG
jgi:hypothetical protein